MQHSCAAEQGLGGALGAQAGDQQPVLLLLRTAHGPRCRQPPRRQRVALCAPASIPACTSPTRPRQRRQACQHVERGVCTSGAVARVARSHCVLQVVRAEAVHFIESHTWTPPDKKHLRWALHLNSKGAAFSAYVRESIAQQKAHVCFSTFRNWVADFCGEHNDGKAIKRSPRDHNVCTFCDDSFKNLCQIRTAICMDAAEDVKQALVEEENAVMAAYTQHITSARVCSNAVVRARDSARDAAGKPSNSAAVQAIPPFSWLALYHH